MARSKMPAMGFGTMEYVDGTHEPEEMQDVVFNACKAGFRMYDCAELYATTEAVGRGLAKAIKGGHVCREDLFVATKLKGMACGEYDAVRERLRAHLKELGLASVDLLYMHWPGPASLDLAGAPEEAKASKLWPYFEENIDSAWRNMQALKKDGLCKEIGVSNFWPHHLARLSKCEGCVRTKVKLLFGLRRLPPPPPRAPPPNSSPLPYANQIYIDSTHPETAFVKEMQKMAIEVVAYRATCFLPVIEMASQMGDQLWGSLSKAAEE